MRSVRSTKRFSLALDDQVEEARRAGRDGASAAALGGVGLFAQQRLDGAHGAHGDILRRLVVDLHAIDALGIDTFDAERLLAAERSR